MINEEHAKAFCCDDISKIENYQVALEDATQTWDCHHRLEIQGEFRNSVELLKKCRMYYNVPAWQLIFLTRADHIRLYKKGKPLSAEHNRKNSEAHKGKKFSAEHKQHISEALKGKKHSEETKQKMRKPKSAEHKRHLSEATKGNHWWTNGEICKFSKYCPGTDFKQGRLNYKRS